MEYSIRKSKRNMIVLSSSFLILYFITEGLFFLLMGPTKLNPLQSGIKKILYLIPFGYLMLIFVDYFRYYHLKVLQITTIAILIFDVVTMGIEFSNGLIANVPKIVLYLISVIWIIAIIIWMILLFFPNRKDYPALISIRKYAICPILIFVFGFSIPFFVKPDNIFNALQLLCIIGAIPYIFTIDFAMKVQLKK